MKKIIALVIIIGVFLLPVNAKASTQIDNDTTLGNKYFLENTAKDLFSHIKLNTMTYLYNGDDKKKEVNTKGYDFILVFIYSDSNCVTGEFTTSLNDNEPINNICSMLNTQFNNYIKQLTDYNNSGTVILTELYNDYLSKIIKYDKTYFNFIGFYNTQNKIIIKNNINEDITYSVVGFKSKDLFKLNKKLKIGVTNKNLISVLLYNKYLTDHMIFNLSIYDKKSGKSIASKSKDYIKQYYNNSVYFDIPVYKYNFPNRNLGIKLGYKIKYNFLKDSIESTKTIKQGITLGVGIPKVKDNGNKVTISWGRVYNAKSYTVYGSKDRTIWTKVKTVKSNKVEFNNKNHYKYFSVTPNSKFKNCYELEKTYNYLS